MQNPSLVIEQIFSSLPTLAAHHSTHSSIYPLFRDLAASQIKTLFSDAKPQKREFTPFGSLLFPYHQMGAINSLDLFGLDELIIFSFYWANRRLYKKVLDIGANLGLHSILMSKAGFEVHAYEPDTVHFKILSENIALNQAKNIHLHNAAVSDKTGQAEFVRVLGNTTSSHLAGSKSAYGELEKYPVKVVDIKQILDGVDLIKLDAEGHEKTILLALSPAQLQKVDILVEIGSPENAQAVFHHLKNTGVRLFAQKKGWAQIQSVEEMPTSYRDGTLFISSKAQMPWG